MVYFLVLRLRSETKIRLDSAETREQFLCLFIVDRGMNDDIFLLLPRLATELNRGEYLPVNGGDEVVLVGQLQGVNDTEDFSRVTASTGGVVDNCANDFLGVDEEYSSDSQCHALCVDVGGILVVDHVVEVSDFARFVGNDGESQIAARDVVDILDPFLMRVQSIGTQSDKFDSSLLEFRLEFGEGAELETSVHILAKKWGRRTSVVQTGVKSSG
jgi:hypothetical protein